MYQFLYQDWDNNRFPGYQEKMNNLYQKSLSYYYEHEKDSSLVFKIDTLFHDLEYYFASLMKLGFVGKSNFTSVLSQLQNIRLIRLLEPKLRSRLNGLTAQQIITMNPFPGCYPSLGEDDSLELSMFHELGHIITDSNKSDIDYFSSCVYQEESLKKHYPSSLFKNGKRDLIKGFEMLDEVVVQNVAEEVFARKRKEKRDKPTLYIHKRLAPNIPFQSNFHEYREFQELAYSFATCLSFLHPKKNEEMDSLLNRFSKAMFSRDFCTKLFQEFLNYPSKKEDLIVMLICMGKIKDAKYTSFGMGEEEEVYDMSSYFQLFHELARKNQCVEDSKVPVKTRS